MEYTIEIDLSEDQILAEMPWSRVVYEFIGDELWVMLDGEIIDRRPAYSLFADFVNDDSENYQDFEGRLKTIIHLKSHLDAHHNALIELLKSKTG